MTEPSSTADAIDEAVRAPLAGVAINGILAIVKISAGLLGNSYALVADGIESTSDILSSLIVWSGLRLSLRPADEKHPWGQRLNRSPESRVQRHFYFQRRSSPGKACVRLQRRITFHTGPHSWC